MKNMTAQEMFGENILKKAVTIYNSSERSDKPFAERVCDELIKPNIEQIEKNCGQKMDPLYCAYVLEYAIMYVQNS